MQDRRPRITVEYSSPEHTKQNPSYLQVLENKQKSQTHTRLSMPDRRPRITIEYSSPGHTKQNPSYL